MNTNSTDDCLKRRDGNPSFPNRIIFNLSLTSREKQIFYIEPIADLCPDVPDVDFQISLLSIFVTFEDNGGLVGATFELVTERKDNFGYNLNIIGWEGPNDHKTFRMQLTKNSDPNNVMDNFGLLERDTNIFVEVDGQDSIAPLAYPRGCTHKIV